MINDSSQQVKLVLCDNHGVGRITCELEPFFEFSFWMAEELQDLVSQHKHPARGGMPRCDSRLLNFNQD